MIRRRTNQQRRGFSLIEILMAILILAIGVVSIAALLPAGIHQQRRAVDDVIAPIVANNAIALIRSRVNPEDFGSFPEWTPWSATFDLQAPRRTVPTDWTWLRPMHLFEDDTNTPFVNEAGAIDLFGWSIANGYSGAYAREFPGGYQDVFNTTSPLLQGMPWSLSRDVDPAALVDPDGFNVFPPRAVITREERWYPQWDQAAPGPSERRPEYMWDCMFRRFQDRVLVGVFVYRVIRDGGEPLRQWQVPANPSDATVPPLPVWLQLAEIDDTEAGWDAYVDGRPNREAPGISPCDSYDVTDQSMSWQEPGQWIIDQNNVVHRVLSTECDASGGFGDQRIVRLVDPVPQSFVLPVDYALVPSGGGGATRGVDDIVSDIWYMPKVLTDGSGEEYRLTPVYVLLTEL